MISVEAGFSVSLVEISISHSHVALEIIHDCYKHQFAYLWRESIIEILPVTRLWLRAIYPGNESKKGGTMATRIYVKVVKFFVLYVLMLLLISVGVVVYKMPQIMQSLSDDQLGHQEQIVLERLKTKVSNAGGSIDRIRLPTLSRETLNFAKLLRYWHVELGSSDLSVQPAEMNVDNTIHHPLRDDTHATQAIRAFRQSQIDLPDEPVRPQSNSAPHSPMSSFEVLRSIRRHSANRFDIGELPNIGNRSGEVATRSMADTASIEKTYLIKLDATQKVTRNEEGIMSVWLGMKGYEPSTGTGAISASVARSTAALAAEVYPILGNGMTYSRISDSHRCMLLSPSGTVDMFKFSASKTGDYHISALVQFYGNSECAGSSSNAQSETISVNVSVEGVWQTVRNSVANYHFVTKSVNQLLDWLMNGENVLLHAISALLLPLFSSYYQNIKNTLKRVTHHEPHFHA